MQQDPIYYEYNSEVLLFNEDISRVLLSFHLFTLLFVNVVAIFLFPVCTTVLIYIFLSFDLYVFISSILLFRMKCLGLINYRKSIFTILVIDSMFVLFAFFLLILLFAHNYLITSIFIE